MPRIRCNYEGCIHLEGNFCTAGEVELDQELGCLTYSVVDDEIEAVVAEDEEEEIEEAVIAEWDDEDEDDEDEDFEDLDDEDDDDDDDDDDGNGWSTSPKSRRR
jgi:hypothetical protein